MQLREQTPCSAKTVQVTASSRHQPGFGTCKYRQKRSYCRAQAALLLTGLIYLGSSCTDNGVCRRSITSAGTSSNTLCSQNLMESAMKTHNEMKRLIRKLPVAEDKEAAIIADLQEVSRSPGIIAVELLTDSDEHVISNARSVLTELEDAALVPLLSVDSSDPEDAVWLLQLLVQNERALRRKIASKILSLMDDQRTLPERQSPGPAPEGGRPTIRVCDEAYLAMRRFVVAEESELAFEDVRAGFLEVSFEARDQTITRACKSQAWQASVSEILDADEEFSSDQE